MLAGLWARARARARQTHESPRVSRKLVRSAANRVALRSEGSRFENAYIMVRLLCCGLPALHSARSCVAHAAGVTSGPGPVEPFASAAPPVHSICHENLPRDSTSAFRAAMLSL